MDEDEDEDEDGAFRHAVWGLGSVCSQEQLHLNNPQTLKDHRHHYQYTGTGTSTYLYVLSSNVIGEKEKETHLVQRQTFNHIFPSILRASTSICVDLSCHHSFPPPVLSFQSRCRLPSLIFFFNQPPPARLP